MNNKTLIGLVLAVCLGLLGVGIYAYTSNRDSQTNSQQPTTTQTVEADQTSDVYKQYAAMKGEMYDRNFLANMIAHHQGAVDMAKLAQSNAKHQELKDMADDIVSAQEAEIAEMLAWQKAWGYPPTSAEDMQDHSAMGMMDQMGNMTAQLEGKTGDEFDKNFISLMIEHHQSAIDMAAPGKDNASRQEIKDLSAAIVSAQTKEIAQMRTWQNQWGYNN